MHKKNIVPFHYLTQRKMLTISSQIKTLLSPQEQSASRKLLSHYLASERKDQYFGGFPVNPAGIWSKGSGSTP